MTNRQRFFINGFLLSIVAISIRSVTLGFNVYIVDNIGEEGVGLFTLVMTVYGFAITFATSGISLTVTKLVSAAIGEGKSTDVLRIMKNSIFYSLLFSVLSCLVLFTFAPQISSRILSDLRCVRPLRILSLSLVPIGLSAVLTGYFVGVKRVAKNAVLQVAGQIFKIVITVGLFTRFNSLGVEASIIALTVSICVTEFAVLFIALFEYVIDKRRYKNGTAVPSYLKAVCNMAFPIALSTYIRSMLLTLEHVIIPKRLTDGGLSHSDALARYGVLHGMALPMLLYPMSPLSSFSGLLVPEFSESVAQNNKQRNSKIASETINTTLKYALSVSAFMTLFAEELGYVMYSSYEAGRYIAVLAPIIPIMYLDHVTDSILKGIGEHVYSMWVNISDSLISVVLLWVLLPKMGIFGYAVVIIVMEGYNFILSAGRLYSKIPFRIDVINSIILPLISCVAAVELSSLLFLNQGASAHGSVLLVKIVFSACAFIFFTEIQKLLISKLMKKKSAKH